MELKKGNSAYRLLVVAPAGVHLKNFLSRIQSETEAIHVITTEPKTTNYPETVLDFSYKSPRNFIKIPQAIRRVHDDFKPDIVHTHQLNSISFFTLLALRKRSTPVASTAWGSDVLLSFKRGGLYRRILSFILDRSDAFTSDSQEVARVMKDLTKKEIKIVVCNFGADAPTLTLPKEKIIYSNRLQNPLYRIDKIINRFAEFKATSAGADWRLILAGSGTESERLKNLISSLGISESVDFQGWVGKDQNEKNYAKSAVWVSIPESDATPISMLEAMYHGCFPVVVDLPSIREWIEDGENGKLVSEVDQPFFSEYLNEIDESIAEKNRALVDQKGSARAANQCFSAIHRRLMNRSMDD
ncbi:MAG: glycosyltransferase family 4 protein [Flavobacteriales bacterium]|nr:glycosyltransferase family 4 protein [Flavobacteriales bacterium]